MVKFYTLYALASDGQIKINSVPNAPAESQQVRSEKKDKSGKTTIDYYRQLTKTDQKYLDWLQKLACMIARQLLPKEWGEFSLCRRAIVQLLATSGVLQLTRNPPSLRV